MIDALDAHPGDTVVEIGAGTGTLTRALLARGLRVTAIELDDALFDLLGREFVGDTNLALWHGNALDFNPCLECAGPYRLTGNIPYYVTGPIVRHFLETPCLPEVLVLMVQREVAERMVAQPGDLSLLGVSVQYYADASIVARVPAGAFFPRPKVDSAVVSLRPWRESRSAEETVQLFALARAGFGTRRKQLANALMTGLHVDRPTALTWLSDAGIDERRRAEELSLDEWRLLARARLGG